MMKKIGLTLSLVLFAILVIAQPKIKFETTTYEFGTIKEENGRVTGRFIFTNIGDSALSLTAVRPGCGCTAANYTKTPVEPGQQGFIDATYDPTNRPGGFSKSIRVTTNEPTQSSPHVIFIKGNVQKRPPTIFEQEGYTNGRGMVRVKNNVLKVDLKNTEKQRDTLLLKNFWTKKVLVEYQNLPAYITEVSRTFGAELEPGKDGKIVLEYDAAKKGAFGKINENIIIKTNDSIDQNKTIIYNVQIKEDFSKLTKKQLENAPVISSDLTSVEFGQLARNTTSKKEIVLTNNGKTPLIIHAVQTSSNALKISPSKITIEPKASLTMTLDFKAQGRVGKQTGTVEIISNDPANDMFIINYSSEILK